jgi:hypothetical protein
MVASPEPTAINESAKAKKHRSPAYPGINLAQAIKRADEFYQEERRNPASFNAASAHWGYKPTSSGALVTAAALKNFGLLTELDSGAGGRTFKISDLGMKIVADKRPESSERDAAIRQAALSPKIHRELWRKYNGNLPSDTELAHRLLWDWNFNENVIPVFVKQFRDTIAFAKLVESDKVSLGDEDKHEDEKPNKVKIGDYVQWESRGMHQFREPKRVSGFSEDGQILFVDGSLTGIPVAEVSVEDAPVNAPIPPVVIPARGVIRNSGGGVTMRQDVFSVTEGDLVLSWPTPLSLESIEEVKDWLKIAERKIARSLSAKDDQLPKSENSDENLTS